MRALQTNKVFFSAYRTDRTLEQNLKAHDDAKETLDNLGLLYQVVTGVYKGATELSIMLDASDARSHESNMQVAIELARINAQESILEVHNDGAAVLHTLLWNGSEVAWCGTFRESSRSNALARESYTYDDATNRYWVVDDAG